MEHTPTAVRLGLWRLTRHDRVRRLYERLSEAGVFLAQLDRFQRGAAGADGLPGPPDGVRLAVLPATEWVPERLEAAPLAPDDRIVVARRGGRPVGWCCLSDRPVYVPELRRRLTFDAAYLWRLYVRPADRGAGIGTALVARAVRAAARDLSSTSIAALVAPDNLPSRKTFDGLGFRPAERFTAAGCFGLEHRRRRPLDG